MKQKPKRWTWTSTAKAGSFKDQSNRQFWCYFNIFNAFRERRKAFEFNL